VLVWDTERAAQLHHDALCKLVTPFGLSTQDFCAANRVVAVDFVTTARVWELVTEAPVAYEPRRWAYADETPEGVTVRIGEFSETRYTRSGSYFRVDPSPNLSGLLSVDEVRRIAGGRQVTEVADQADTEDSELFGERGPRTWDSVTEIPVGIRFRLVSAKYVYERADDHCVQLDSGALYALHLFRDLERGFVEVLCEPVPEAEVVGLTVPRTWATVDEVPFGVMFRPSSDEDDDDLYRWQRGSTGTQFFFETFPGSVERIVSADAIDARFIGFMEVLP
jgi:hypothetical protein